LRFLRHIERNSVLLFLVPVDSENIKKEYKILLNELKKYNPELLDKKRMLAISKCDIVPYDNLEKIKNKLPNDLPVVFLSSQIHMGVDEIKDTLWNLLNTNN
jgi:GTP-binding protein